MKNRISILGCGWLGNALAVQLIQQGYDVKGSTSSERKMDEIQSQGIESYMIDIGNHDIDLTDFLSADILIIAITSKEIVDYKNLILKVEKSQLRKVIFISSTSVYPNANGIITEKSPHNSSILTEIEGLLTINSHLDTTIVRFGGLFGYDRKPSNFIKPNNKIEKPEGYINFIHRDDCISIIEKIIAKGIWNTTLNACADSHPKRRDFYEKEYKKDGKPSPVFNEESVNTYKIVSNEKLKDILGFRFKYADLMSD